MVIDDNDDDVVILSPEKAISTSIGSLPPQRPLSQAGQPVATGVRPPPGPLMKVPGPRTPPRPLGVALPMARVAPSARETSSLEARATSSPVQEKNYQKTHQQSPSREKQYCKI